MQVGRVGSVGATFYAQPKSKHGLFSDNLSEIFVVIYEHSKINICTQTYIYALW